jgi:hypothetical protein
MDEVVLKNEMEKEMNPKKKKIFFSFHNISVFYKKLFTYCLEK